MTPTYRIRPPRPGDAPAIAAIFNEGIAERQATFETEPREPGDFAELGAPDAPPALVSQRDGEVVGWARVSPYSPRDCYAGVGEFSVYVASGARGGGTGLALVEALAEEAERRGYWKLIGLLFPENEASRAVCERAGFHEVGTYRRHGRLDGRWRDVLLVERLLGPAAATPAGGGGTA